MTDSNTLPPGRIIVADDELDIGEYIKILLQEHHYEVFTAASGEEALAILEKYDSDVLVTDIRMSGISGFELIEKAKRIRKYLQYIVITGHGDKDSAVMSLRLGATGYLQKPLDFAELEAYVALALDKSRLVRQVQILNEVNERLRQEIELRNKAEEEGKC